MKNLDAVDINLLNALQRDASLSRKRLSQICHISEATCSRRIASLKRQGFIGKTTLKLDPKKFGLRICIFVLVTLEKEDTYEMRKLTEQWAKIPYVLSIDYISGEYDYILHLAMRDIDQYQEFTDEHLLHNASVKKYLSLFQMKEIKHVQSIPIEKSLI